MYVGSNPSVLIFLAKLTTKRFPLFGFVFGSLSNFSDPKRSNRSKMYPKVLKTLFDFFTFHKFKNRKSKESFVFWNGFFISPKVLFPVFEISSFRKTPFSRLEISRPGGNVSTVLLFLEENHPSKGFAVNFVISFWFLSFLTLKGPRFGISGIQRLLLKLLFIIKPKVRVHFSMPFEIEL